MHHQKNYGSVATLLDLVADVVGTSRALLRVRSGAGELARRAGLWNMRLDVQVSGAVRRCIELY